MDEEALRTDRERVVRLLNEAQSLLHYDLKACDMLQALKACIWNTTLDVQQAYIVEREVGIKNRAGL